MKLRRHRRYGTPVLAPRPTVAYGDFPRIPPMLGIGLGLLGLTAFLMYWLRNTDESAADEPEVLPPSGGNVQILHRERADGVDSRLQDFLTWWSSFGPFPIMVGGDGGVRTLATQAKLYAQGRVTPGPHAGESGYPLLGQTVTNADTNANSAHGHAAALDLWPVIGGRALLDDSAQTAAYYAQMGAVAESHGFEWGGRWKKPDMPHIQIPGWQKIAIA